MKKRFVSIVMVLFLMIGSSVFAGPIFEFSLGLSAPGIGMGFFRGSGVASFADDLKAETGSKAKIDTISYAPAVQINAMFEFFSYLAIETGIGYTYSKTALRVNENNRVDFVRNEMVFPLALRLQFETILLNGYISVGAKFGVPVVKNLTTYVVNGVETKFDDYSDSTIYAAFAIGLEVRLFSSNYLGIRAGYDFNLKGPMDVTRVFGEGTDKRFANDNYNISLTYRYAFDSKWRKK